MHFVIETHRKSTFTSHSICFQCNVKSAFFGWIPWRKGQNIITELPHIANLDAILGQNLNLDSVQLAVRWSWNLLRVLLRRLWTWLFVPCCRVVVVNREATLLSTWHSWHLRHWVLLRKSFMDDSATVHIWTQCLNDVCSTAITLWPLGIPSTCEADVTEEDILETLCHALQIWSEIQYEIWGAAVASYCKLGTWQSWHLRAGVLLRKPFVKAAAAGTWSKPPALTPVSHTFATE